MNTGVITNETSLETLTLRTLESIREIFNNFPKTFQTLITINIRLITNPLHEATVLILSAHTSGR